VKFKTWPSSAAKLGLVEELHLGECAIPDAEGDGWYEEADIIVWMNK
jgi:hypothetical protein